MDVLPKAWQGWYRLALDELGFEHDEAVEYANVRYVEDRNRAELRGSADARAAKRRAVESADRRR